MYTISFNYHKMTHSHTGTWMRFTLILTKGLHLSQYINYDTQGCWINILIIFSCNLKHEWKWPKIAQGNTLQRFQKPPTESKSSYLWEAFMFKMLTCMSEIGHYWLIYTKTGILFDISKVRCSTKITFCRSYVWWPRHYFCAERAHNFFMCWGLWKMFKLQMCDPLINIYE